MTHIMRHIDVLCELSMLPRMYTLCLSLMSKTMCLEGQIHSSHNGVASSNLFIWNSMYQILLTVLAGATSYDTVPPVTSGKSQEEREMYCVQFL